MKVTPEFAFWKDSPRAPMTDFMEVEPSVATEPVSSPPAGAEEAEEAGALPLLPQPASRASARTAEARMVTVFFIQIFLSGS